MNWETESGGKRNGPENGKYNGPGNGKNGKTNEPGCMGGLNREMEMDREMEIR